jgi:hypothetical protein
MSGGFGSTPFGTGPFGLGMPSTGTPATGQLFADAQTGTIGTGRKIDPATRQYAFDSDGNPVGRTRSRSSCNSPIRRGRARAFCRTSARATPSSRPLAMTSKIA